MGQFLGHSTIGLAHIESRGQELFIGLTSAGAELAKLNNPLLHVEDFELFPSKTLSQDSVKKSVNGFGSMSTNTLS